MSVKLKLVILIFTCLLIASVKTEAAECDIPITQQLYCCSMMDDLALEDLARVGVKILSHVKFTDDEEEMKRYIEKAHSLGIKLLPYVSVEKAWHTGYGNHKGAPHYEVIAPENHQEWILIGEDGRPKPRYGSWYQKEDGTWDVKWGRWFIYGEWHEVTDPEMVRKVRAYSWYMCPAVEGYRQAVIDGIKATMDMGFDGVFHDNVHPLRMPQCHNPEFNKHKHVDGDDTNKSYQALGRIIYETVKSYGSDKIVALNSGRDEVYENYRDSCMLESYILGAGRKRWTWEKTAGFAEELKDEYEKGRAVYAFSYLRTNDSMGVPDDLKDKSDHFSNKDDMFFAYACAKLPAFIWSCQGKNYRDICRIFYRAALVKPLGKMEKQNGLHYRHYTNGMVVVNPAEKLRHAQLSIPWSVKDPVDLYSVTRLPSEFNAAMFDVPAESGRVIVDAKNAVAYLLDDCIMDMEYVLKYLPNLDEKTTGLDKINRSDMLNQGKELVDKLYCVLKEARTELPEGKSKTEFLKLLSETQTWCRTLKPVQSLYIWRSRRSAEYAGALSALLVDVRISFKPEKPVVSVKDESKVQVEVINTDYKSCRIKTITLDLPIGWTTETLSVDVEKDLAPKQRLSQDFTFTILPSANPSKNQTLVAIVDCLLDSKVPATATAARNPALKGLKIETTEKLSDGEKTVE